MTWIRERIVLLLGIAVLVYTFIPIAVVVLMSFNDPASRLIYRFDGFTLHNWLNICEDPSMCDALWRSIQIGLLATLVSVILGTLAAFALVRHQFVGRSTMNLLIFLPMATPEIVMGVALFLVFDNLYDFVPFGTWAQFLGHVTFSISFVVIIVRGRLFAIGRDYEEAAMDLGASPFQAMRRVLLPLLAPALLASFAIVFAISIDDLVPSTKLLNILEFMPAAAACSAVMPKCVQTVAGVDW